MKKILMVDDEPFIRKAFKRLVKWEDDGFTIAGEASNGSEALKMIQNNHYDLIITDIRMPVMDGIELIKNVKKIKPYIGIVVLSAFDEFSIVREAFKLGAEDYFIKAATNLPDILDVLKRVVSRQDEETNKRQKYKRMNTELSVARDSLKHSFISDMIWGGFDDEEQMRIKFKSLEFNINYDKNVLVVLECISGKSDVIPLYISNIPEMVRYEIFNFIQGQYIMLLNLEEKDSFTIRDLKNSLKELVERMMKVSETDVRVGISNSMPGFEFICAAYAQAVRAKSYMFFDNSKRVFLYKDYSSLEHDKYSWGTKYRTEIKKYLNESGNLEEVTKLLELIKEDVSEMKSGDVEEVLQFYTWMTTSILDYLSEMGCEIKDRTYLQKLSNSRFLEDLHEAVVKIVEEGNDDLKSSNSRIHEFDKKIVKFIKEKYSEDISLSEAAKFMGFSESYFSRAFSKSFDKSFISYITDLRISKAKKLLTDTDMMVYEVAYTVGYNSGEYFNRIFKKNSGCTPVEFRRTLKEGNK